MAQPRGGWPLAILPVLVVALLLPLATFLVCVWLLGWQLVSVQSGSMARTYPVGSLLVMSSVDPADVEPGMAIAFEDPALPGRLVTHRVIARVPGDQIRFWTKGDANTARDPLPVPASNVRSRVLWHVPQLGTLTGFIQWPWSAVLLIGVPSVLLAASEIRTRRDGRRSEGRL